MFPGYYSSIYSIQDPNTGEWVPWNDNKRYGAIVNFYWTRNQYIHFDAERLAQYKVWKSNCDLARLYGFSDEQIKTSYGTRIVPKATLVKFDSKTLVITELVDGGDPLI